MRDFTDRMIRQILFALLLPLALANMAEAQKITVAVSNPDMSFLSGGVAKFKGFFKKRGSTRNCCR
jgi:hypothetical protein